MRRSQPSSPFERRPPKPAYTRPPEVPDDALASVFTVRPEHAGLRLDRWLVVEMPRLTRTRAQRIVAEWAFDATARALSPSHRVRAGEVVVVFRPLWEEPDAPREVDILHLDAEVIAVSKPAGLPVHPTARFHRNTLTAVLAERFPGERVTLAHRLDRETSGVILAARTYPAERHLKESFAGRDVEKTYLAIAHGVIPDDRFEVDAPLCLEGGEVGVRMCVRPEAQGGLASRTRFEVIERLDGFTLVACYPETGRQHQIRVHLAHAGHPIVGDKLYAHSDEVFLACLEGPMDDAMRARLHLPRQALHAHAIRLAHPAGGELQVTAPLAPDLAEFCDRHRAPSTPRSAGDTRSP
jgi:23S rRNA pseudouridine1911/1915/1917 synthase